jgi:hypothetical protein
LTRDNIRKAALVAALVLCAFSVARGADLPTREITSNNIYGFAGNGDTLWMVTDQGLNYTIATSDTLTWLGYKAPLAILALGFGGGEAVACLDTAHFYKTAKLWYYSHTAHSYDSVGLAFKPDSLPKDAVVRGLDVAYAGNAFWIACTDGGLVRWDPAGDPKGMSMRAFFPDVKRVFDPAAVRLGGADGFSVFPDSSKRVIAVGVRNPSADSTTLFVLTPAALFRFSPWDTLWERFSSRLSGAAGAFDKFLDLFSSPRSPLLFASIVTKTGTDTYDTLLYRYNAGDSSWATFTSSQFVTSITFGPDSTVYLVRKPNRNESPRILSAYSGNIKNETTRSEQSFARRISLAMNGLTPDNISDILYLPKSDTSGSFWIGTASPGVINNGLFFSRNEGPDEAGGIPFVYVHRERKIESGLKESYAYPGILGNDFSTPTRSIFAYSLARASKVNITVYDWNMDLVKNVITNEDRRAGKDDPLGNGRSTDRTRDFWDGTNNAGRRVAVGVYYFRITAQTGERSFGKIIVAK